MDDRLRQLQLAELEILDEFVRVCEIHGLRYYLIGGTLLGAVRHQGFIPWDDDIDVVMPRADYDQLAAIWPESAAPEYFYQCPNTDPFYYLTYAKIRKNGTEVYEERFRDARFHKGIFIDVFPLDDCPRPGPAAHLLFNVLAVMNYRGQIDSGESYKPYRELSGKIGYALLRVFGKKQLVKVRREFLSLSAKLGKGAYLASYSGAYGYYKEVYPASWFGAGKRLRFETRDYTVPGAYELVLQQAYGTDYLIPKKDSNKHVEIDE